MIDSKNGVIGLAGIYYGLKDVNEKWKSSLIKYDYIVELCEKFNGVINEKKKVNRNKHLINRRL